MEHQSPRKNPMVVRPKHGAHAPHNIKIPEKTPENHKPSDPEDLAADAELLPDEQPWEQEDERVIRESWEDPEETNSI